MASEHSPSIKSLILVPSLITLAVTVLRLVGELNDWPSALFAKQAGGAGAIIGIVWLIFLFGFYFGLKLARSGPAPRAGAAIGQTLLALGVVLVPVLIVSRVLKLGPTVVLPTAIVLGLFASWIAWRAWPALGRTLLAYGLAARIPVIIVMLIAMLQNWGTHYDVVPPGYPVDTPTLAKWFQIGVVPQLFIWVSPFTIVLGALCGAIALLFARTRQPVTA
jgi:hypothetical protein